MSAALVTRLLATVKQRLRDADFEDNSNETRFDCAYTAIRAVADIGLHLHGYRTSTSKPGHHQIAIQCLAHTLEVDLALVRILDSLRKQRNLSDYDGELVTNAALQECVSQAKSLVACLQTVLAKRPDFSAEI